MTDWAMRPTRPQAGLATLIDMRPTTGSSGCGIALLRIEPLWRRTGRTWHTAAWPAGVNSACQLPRGADTGGREGVQRHPRRRPPPHAPPGMPPQLARRNVGGRGAPERRTSRAGPRRPGGHSTRQRSRGATSTDQVVAARAGRWLPFTPNRRIRQPSGDMSGQVRPRPARPGHVGSADRRRIVAITCRIVLIGRAESFHMGHRREVAHVGSSQVFSCRDAAQWAPGRNPRPETGRSGRPWRGSRPRQRPVPLPAFLWREALLHGAGDWRSSWTSISSITWPWSRSWRKVGDR